MDSLRQLLVNIFGIQRTCGYYAAGTYSAAILRNLPDVLRQRNLTAADREMAHRNWTFNVQGISIEIDGELFSGAREMYCRGVYFAPPGFDLNPGAAVVDLGANVGLFSLVSALKGCRVIAVEAQQGFLSEIDKLATKHGVREAIALEHALVGSNKGVFADPTALREASHFGDKWPRSTSMEEIIEKHDLSTIDLLKVDIEGSEFALFENCETWIPRVRRIAAEVHSRFGAPEVLRDRIKSSGMSVQLFNSRLRPVKTLQTSDGYLFARRT